MNLVEMAERIDKVDKNKLADIAKRLRGDILTMTTLSGSGHPGGSMSSIDLLAAIYSIADINPTNASTASRDKVIVSNGHISPAVYSVLAEFGFIPKDDAISQFRKAGSIYEGHIERTIPGVEWTTGNLGQGLSAAAGFAVAGRTLGSESDIYVLMGDGEQEKGQIAEARRFIKKYNFNNVTAIIDYNCLQISGDIHQVMPSLDIAAGFKADGWLVIEIDGHNFDDIMGALLKAKSADKPVMILAKTIMGKGVSFMEDKCGYHGSTLPADMCENAMAELTLTMELDRYKALRGAFKPNINDHEIKAIEPIINSGEAVTYIAGIKTDNRSAFGTAIEDIVSLNEKNPIVVFDCDLASSVKTGVIEKNYPNNFYQCGIAEHHTAVCAGAASISGVVSFFADFGMFGVDEVYNQHRLNGINETNLKLVTTHVGVDVGEDGKTHMCIDYLGLMRNIFGFKVIVPADPNQTDRAVRYAAKTYGNFHIAMGRSKLPIITNDKGEPFFAGDYEFEYGSADIIRAGEYPLFSYGTMLHRALRVREILAGKGVSVSVINISNPTFLHKKYAENLLKSKKAFIYEDHISESGLFSTIANMQAHMGVGCKIMSFGVDRFPFSGTPDEVYKMLRLDPESVAEQIFKEVSR